MATQVALAILITMSSPTSSFEALDRRQISASISQSATPTSSTIYQSRGLRGPGLECSLTTQSTMVSPDQPLLSSTRSEGLHHLPISARPEGWQQPTDAMDRFSLTAHR